MPPRRNKTSSSNRLPAQSSGVVKRSAAKAITPRNLRHQLEHPKGPLPNDEAALPAFLQNRGEPTVSSQYRDGTLSQPKHVTGHSSRQISMVAEDDGVCEAAMILLYMGNKKIRVAIGPTAEAPCKAQLLREQREQNEKVAMEALQSLKVEKQFGEGLVEERKNWQRHEQVAARSLE